MPYRSPEILLGKYTYPKKQPESVTGVSPLFTAPAWFLPPPFTQSIDIWSLGVVVLELCLGSELFMLSGVNCANGEPPGWEEQIRALGKCLSLYPSSYYVRQYEYKSDQHDAEDEDKNEAVFCWTTHVCKVKQLLCSHSIYQDIEAILSPSFVHFISQCVHPCPRQRIRAGGCLSHPYLCQGSGIRFPIIAANCVTSGIMGSKGGAKNSAQWKSIARLRHEDIHRRSTMVKSEYSLVPPTPNANGTNLILAAALSKLDNISDIIGTISNRAGDKGSGSDEIESKGNQCSNDNSSADGDEKSCNSHISRVQVVVPGTLGVDTLLGVVSSGQNPLNEAISDSASPKKSTMVKPFTDLSTSTSKHGRKSISNVSSVLANLENSHVSINASSTAEVSGISDISNHYRESQISIYEGNSNDDDDDDDDDDDGKRGKQEWSGRRNLNGRDVIGSRQQNTIGYESSDASSNSDGSGGESDHESDSSGTDALLVFGARKRKLVNYNEDSDGERDRSRKADFRSLSNSRLRSKPRTSNTVNSVLEVVSRSPAADNNTSFTIADGSVTGGRRHSHSSSGRRTGGVSVFERVHT